MAIHMLSDMIEAIKELVEENSYLLVVLSVSCSVDLRQLKVIRRLTQAPVLVILFLASFQSYKYILVSLPAFCGFCGHRNGYNSLSGHIHCPTLSEIAVHG